jgi:hypothetical protein
MDVIPEQVVLRIVDNGVRLSEGRTDQGKVITLGPEGPSFSASQRSVPVSGRGDA